jgi:hypothetical protein
VDDEAAIVYDDTFTDDFARMTMFVHGGGGSVGTLVAGVGKSKRG